MSKDRCLLACAFAATLVGCATTQASNDAVVSSLGENTKAQPECGDDFTFRSIKYPDPDKGWVPPLTYEDPSQACIKLGATFSSQGYRAYYGNNHAGVDLFAEPGTSVKAISNGVVLFAAIEGGTNDRNIVIKHTTKSGASFCGIYQHTDSHLPIGHEVEAGDEIGRLLAFDKGLSEHHQVPKPHLHFGINTSVDTQACIKGWGRTERNVDPATLGFVDPLIWLNDHYPGRVSAPVQSEPK